MGFLNTEGLERLWTHIVARIDEKVSSVNGKRGDVVLTAEDVGALPNTTEIPTIDGLATTTYVDENFALKSDIENIELSNYYTKTEIDALELITVNDIDAICGANIQMASEVEF